ncbi:hypothetical protein [Kordiimonas gwangyangensis]|nr:hypothetical protein [Kordiimonas gwangyangensis]
MRPNAAPEDACYHCLECGSYYSEKRPRFSSLSLALAWGGILALATLGALWVINFLQAL